jgi:predicted dehydrogenase
MRVLLFCLFLLVSIIKCDSQKAEKIKIGVAGMTHGHVHWILNQKENSDFEIVGFSESNKELALRLLADYDFPKHLYYENLDQLVSKEKPDAVLAFNSIKEHLEVVRTCAPLGIHVMVEKPLATTTKDAEIMAQLAHDNDILLLTNFESSWYPVVRYVSNKIDNDESFRPTKIEVYMGHQGPKEIGCSPEFLDWLTDPKMNGGGASIDFGCYGANLATVFMKGKMPKSVTAVLNQFKPTVYPKVDDEATIVLDYGSVQTVIQASWNWPHSRKDMKIYSKDQYIETHTGELLTIFKNKSKTERKIPALDYPSADPFSYLVSLIKDQSKSADAFSNLDTNVKVVKILEAAIKSAKKSKTIFLKE